MKPMLAAIRSSSISGRSEKGYFDPRWEREMMQRKQVIGGVPGLDSEDHNHAALYEAVVRDWE